MKLFVFSTLLAVALAKPSAFLAPTFYAAGAPVAINTINTAPVVTQYHSQDELGQYTYGYNGGLSAKSEVKSLDGVTRGAYSYIDAEGKIQSVEYTADAVNGFRAAASNLPVAPIETRVAPEPVRETEEVAKARADHMIAFEEAKIRAAAEPEIPETPIEAAPAVVPLTRTVAPLLAPAPIAAPLPILRTAANIESRPFGFSYAYSAPTFGYPYYYNYYPHNFVRSALPIQFAAAPQFLPQPVMETAEVARARAEHLAAHAEAKARL